MDLILPVNASEKEKTLTRQGCVFSGQELLDNHEIDPEKECYCGRPNKGTNQNVMYEARLRHLETPEFVAWFETWYAKEDDYNGNESLRDMYLNERNFALAGWLAAKNGRSHLMSKEEFVLSVLPLR